MINFVICNASLELYRKKKDVLLHQCHHSEYVAFRKNNFKHILSTNKDRKWEEIRPDILHFCLMSLQDSILNKEGNIQIWMETLNGKLYKISPDFRIPRTWKVFNKVFAKYLSSGSRTLLTDDNVTLVELLDVPLRSLVPNDAIKIAITQKGVITKLINFIDVGNIDKLWFFISASPIRHFETSVRSNVIDTSEVFKRLIERDKTPNDPNYSQNLEDTLLNDGDSRDNQSFYTHSIATSQYNVNPITICYSIVCTIETLLGY